MIGWVFDSFVILTLLLLLVNYTAKGYLSIEQTAMFIVGFVILVALSRALKIRLTRLILRIGIPTMALLLFVFTYTGGRFHRAGEILSLILVLLIMLMGIYIMIIGSFKRK